MKQFFITMLASFVGFLLGMVFLSVVSFAGVFLLISIFSSGEEVYVKDKSILHIQFNKPISDRGQKSAFDDGEGVFGGLEGSPGLVDILKVIDRAKVDPKIAGIYLDLSSPQLGMASAQEIRESLVNFKKSGKFIYAYSEAYSLKAYYLSSVADSIMLNPQGGIDFKGLGAEIMFLKGALDKLGIEAQVIRHGKFKSAVEPFISDRMSQENRLQTEEFVRSIWNEMVKSISEARKISVSELNLIADSLKAQRPVDALKFKLADKLYYKDEVLESLKSAVSAKDVKSINFITLKKYLKSHESREEKDLQNSSNEIAVIYATGQINSGSGSEDAVGSDTFSKEIRKARKDDKIKAIVLRVNSPGGSALASDVIWREILLAKKVKPVVVSMGDVAASGGYYIACAADKIVADANTITGSIGVFGIIPNMKDMMNNKLGLTFDVIKTNDNADFLSVYRPMTRFEQVRMQREIEDIYDVFTQKVSTGRKLSQTYVDSIGQGRVWSGTMGKNIGLVDTLGGLQTSIKLAAKLAKIENYKTLSLPEQEDFFTRFISKYSTSYQKSELKNKLGFFYKYYLFVEDVLINGKIQARVPYYIGLE